ncbi:hypothetical protein C8D77_1382 [Mesorhizobium loti]|uniref:Uncharacterized protein n=1 Tax=Rhizobium loti TaxID=381 RepID=A0A8E2W4Z9_RHILI|nr:hypothetical protein C8D77_1382 [Mesorhizobium loti]
MVFVAHWPSKFATYKKMRQVRKQRHGWHGFQQIECEEEVRREPIAVRLKINREASAVADLHPPLNKFDPVRQSTQSYVGLHIEMQSTKLTSKIDLPPQIIIARREPARFDKQVGSAEGLFDCLSLLPAADENAYAIKGRFCNHSEVFV